MCCWSPKCCLRVLFVLAALALALYAYVESAVADFDLDAWWRGALLAHVQNLTHALAPRRT